MRIPGKPSKTTVDLVSHSQRIFVGEAQAFVFLKTPLDDDDKQPGNSCLK